MNRRQERAEALSLIFEAAFNTDTEIDSILETAEDARGIKVTEYMRDTVKGVYDNLPAIDAVIAKHLKKGWKAERLSQITRAILRYAVYEMMFSEGVPENIAINEAVELAKIYDADDSPAFINGVLGGASRSGELKTARGSGEETETADTDSEETRTDKTDAAENAD